MTTQSINWTVTSQEASLIEQIVNRAVAVARKAGVKYTKQNIWMDLTAAHCNGCRLNLTGLLAAPDFDFAHDVFGIRRYLDRTTGELTDCFIPRLADHETA